MPLGHRKYSPGRLHGGEDIWRLYKIFKEDKTLQRKGISKSKETQCYVPFLRNHEQLGMTTVQGIWDEVADDSRKVYCILGIYSLR